MAGLTHLQKLIAKKLVFINFLTSTAQDGQKIFYYIASYTDQLLKLDQVIRKGAGYFDPSDYGAVIKWGYGEPTDEIKSEMKEKFMFDHNKMITIVDPAAAA